LSKRLFSVWGEVMSTVKLNVAVLGASGYTGAEMLRLLANHDGMSIEVATANSLAGRQLNDIFPHLSGVFDHPLTTLEESDFTGIDLVFSCLPHGTSQDSVAKLPAGVRVVDLSADYRFRSAQTYSTVYGRDHLNPNATKEAVYGLTEFARPLLKDAPLVACPGCYPTATLLCLLPVAEANLVSQSNLIIDAKSGVSGAGRGLKEGNLFCEAAEGLHPYAVGAHRHAPEIEQELSSRFGTNTLVTFTPHLVPMTRGELVTIYANLNEGQTAQTVHAALKRRYADERFVRVRPLGDLPPDTRHTRGTNMCEIAVFEDRVPGRVIIVGAIDNLIKGSAGQALQNANLMFGFDEGEGLSFLTPLFP
jgi:N-acetyl-gamma-glutamyl-phosphate reductase